MRTTLLFIAAALAAPLALIGWFGRGLNDPASLALALALGAVCLGILGVIRSHLLEFSPEVLAGDVIIPRSSTARGDVKLLLPLQFLNSGSTDGVVQWIALRLTIDGDIQRSVLLSPVAEVDMQRFIQAKRKLDGDNTIEPFTAFPLEAKRSMAKFVLFDIAERARTQPLHLRPGRYSFELFVKTTATRTHKLERVFEHQVEPKHLEEFRNDAPVYLIHYQMTLPSARREMTGAEWMPRTTRFSN
jgi:hypothetical protein